jgi:hypothetical protein
MDAGYEARAKQVLEPMGKKWSHMLAYEFAYLDVRVKRKIPAPAQLYARIKAFFDFFADKVNRESKKPLFNVVSKRKEHFVSTWH